MKKLLLLIITVLLTACATQQKPIVQMGGYFQPDNASKQKTKATLYLYRKHDQYNPYGQVTITANNKPLTILVDSSYQSINLSPGDYQFSVKPWGYKTSAHLKANQTYYLELLTKTALKTELYPTGLGYDDLETIPVIVSHNFSLVPETKAIDNMAFCKKITKITYPDQSSGQALTAPSSKGGVTVGLGAIK